MKKILYSDGSGNTWTVSPTTVDYNPVQPETSSSGIYSGGKNYTKAITTEQFQLLKMAVSAALADKEAHITNRVKGSGYIESYTENAVVKIIISPDSKHREIIETILKSYVAFVK